MTDAQLWRRFLIFLAAVLLTSCVVSIGWGRATDAMREQSQHEHTGVVE